MKMASVPNMNLKIKSMEYNLLRMFKSKSDLEPLQTTDSQFKSDTRKETGFISRRLQLRSRNFMLTVRFD